MDFKVHVYMNNVNKKFDARVFLTLIMHKKRIERG